MLVIGVLCVCIYVAGGALSVPSCSPIDAGHVDEQTARDLVSAEIGILKSIRHPNIIHMEDYFEDADSISIVMELLPDGDLYTRVRGTPSLKSRACARSFDYFVISCGLLVAKKPRRFKGEDVSRSENAFMLFDRCLKLYGTCHMW